ncbi:MAG: hypothetical protein COW01_04015 [Bdellovibrionales bacterium CG12_big_fil_rev_8_21_14_0_65_38_15]|nr:MAG: hypothetical protein COW79_12920 [Bdellovibrionales bacterium CG22_combo_CG10-13_8_21_14_all_38_13]PIQ56629.1 MAG: hypothetical protein COW01_04015 [Bdellovibrionales bacterium CG12_big_fil_rev_8_21_14_0_65_38_15]PIR31254.1 MAG: hypothetical protein COV38_01475 [Bdellovibrionales bacterium CG11_big_fil_rev_8_21_14_0_20_38_13]
MSTVIIDEVEMPKNMNFFILEDTPLFQKKMVDSLNDLGFSGNVTVADNIAMAYKKLEDKKTHFILSDWNLPDGKGIDFLKKIRADSNYDGIPFIMVTTMDGVDEIIDAAQIGADDYIIKPWEEDEFAKKISSAYQKRVNK